MSTMLKTAAMSLLSKTLQSFLHKYLLEVDVEGVAMPSLIDIDGHSGWGVRLCNVKLREGAELMALPGKRKVKKKRKRDEVKESNNPGFSHDDESRRKMDESTITYKDKFSKHSISQQEIEEIAEERTASSPTSSIHRGRLMTDDDVEIDSAISSRAQSPSKFCKTSVTGAITGCLSRNNKGKKPDERTEVRSPSPSALLSKESDSLVKHDVVFDTDAIEESEKSTKEKIISPINSEKDEDEEVMNENQNYEVNIANTSDRESVDEYVTIEEDMVLRLGKSGTIGTLDIRLIGKELHVTVEDAFLIVEACPKPEELDDVSVRTASTADTTKDDAVLKAKKKKPKSGLDKKEKSVGERVIENFPLAKALSACPHLFLRDVRVQLIIRKKSEVAEEKESCEVGPDDSIVEFGIELLSVTSGEDILANFFNDDDPSPPDLDDLGDSSERSRKHVSLKALEERDENEYLRRRIRTGKGPDGGISIKVYYPQKKRNISKAISDLDSWAYQSFNSKSQFTIFRCSGLDVVARIFLGKEKEVAIRNNDYAWYGDEYDEYTIDSMLYGVDYIAPSAPPLPPIQKVVDSRLFSNKTKAEVEVFTTDENGIQSNKIRSCFHKVARGLSPILSKKEHLPSENSPYCWRDNSRPNSYSEHPFDSRTPLPGFVFSMSLNEPLEINIDRPSLEVLGSLQELFIKSAEEVEVSKEYEVEEELTKPEKTSIAQKIKNMANFRKKEKKEVLKSAFPSYMKPESIQILGMSIQKIVIRVHAMKRPCDSGLSFRYWEAIMRCSTIDIQKLTSKDKKFMDVRSDFGLFESYDYRGVEKRSLISLGTRQPDYDEADYTSNVSTLTNLEQKNGNCWPTTAAVLLQVPYNSEASKYESRERHGIQLRYLFVDESDSEIPVKTLYSKIGLIEAELSDSFSTELTSIITEAQNIVFGNKENLDAVAEKSDDDTSSIKDKEKKTPSLLAYSVILDGGNVRYLPLVHVRFPVLKFGGQHCSVSGLLFETMLNHVKIEFGKRSQIGKQQNKWTISHLANLPVNTRMRVLLFLNDLSPLEKALGMKRQSNSFLRCQAVNKTIVKVAKQQSTSKHMKRRNYKLNSGTGLSRQEILKQMTKLDEKTLANLWMLHQGSKLGSTPAKKTNCKNND